MTDRKRADVLLVEQGLCESRERAQAAIMEGRVYLGEKRINKPSEQLSPEETLAVRSGDNDYVSRGALKLEKAIRVFGAKMDGRVVMDIGASTGGFTDVCLRAGAKRVYSIDVGYGQLDWKLRNDPRVTVMERTNARYLEPGMFPEKPEITVMDVSFISVRLIIPTAVTVMGDSGIIYTLIKPQFEAGRENVGKNGVIRDPAVHESVLQEVMGFAKGIGWPVIRLDWSPITGPKGNIEFIAEMRKGNEKTESVTGERAAELVREAHASLGSR